MLLSFPIDCRSPTSSWRILMFYVFVAFTFGTLKMETLIVCGPPSFINTKIRKTFLENILFLQEPTPGEYNWEWLHPKCVIFE